MSEILNPNHQSVMAAPDVKEICYPLFTSTEITEFVYARIFDYGATYSLNSNAEWQLLHFNHQHLVSPPLPTGLVNNKCVFILSQQNVPPVFKRTLQSFRKILKMDYPYFMIERYQGYYDLYVFCTKVNNEGIINFYLNEQAYIERFKQYFHSKARNLKRDAEKNIIILPTAMQPRIDWSGNNAILLTLNPQHYSVFYNNLELSFTRKEAECLKYLSNGYTFKSIARYMHISHKTVEFHINNIKVKTGFNTKSSLIEFVNHSKSQIQLW